MALTRRFELGQIATFVAALVVGLGVGTMVGGPVAVPAVGTAPGVLVGSIGVLAGGGLYAGVKRTAGCGCGGACDC